MNRKRNVLIHLFLLIGCSWAVIVQFVYRIPVSFVSSIMPLVSISAACISAVLLITHAMGQTPIEEPFRRIFYYLERWSIFLILVFCLYNVFVYINARYDTSRPVTYSTEVLELRAGQLDLGVSIPYAYAKVRSWRTPNESESLFLHFEEQENVWPGQAVTVEVRDGYFYIPWVLKIAPDEEKRLLLIINSLPTASKAWKDLTDLYIKLNRWPDAKNAAVEYLKYYPADAGFAVYYAPSFISARLFNDAVSILEPVAAQKFHYELYLQLGFSMAMAGRKVDGLKFINKAVEKEPENYRGYYILGKTHLRTADPASAIPAYEKALKLRPNYPEVEGDLQQMRALVSQQKLKSQ
jgi:tetratricopeptide (TPR) repeat protein